MVLYPVQNTAKGRQVIVSLIVSSRLEIVLYFDTGQPQDLRN